MSKLTFRADDELVAAVERLDASKSEVMREALRAYLDDLDGRRTGDRPASDAPERSLDAMIEARVDALVEERLREREVNLNITVEGAPERAPRESASVTREGEATDGPTECAQCGEPIADDHVYCPNCGEKRSRRAFCECGDEVRTDWSFCPSCGRRTPAADVLDGP